MRKIELNTERELFFQLLWILPLIPMLVLVIMGIFWFIILLLTWFNIFGYMYCFYYASLYIFDDKFVIKTIKKKYEISFSDILMINEIKKINNSLAPIQYKLVLKENKQNIPERFLLIINKKFQKIYKNFNFNIVKTNILD